MNSFPRLHPLHRLGSLPHPAVPVLTDFELPTGRPAPGSTGEALCSRKASKKRDFPSSSKIALTSNGIYTLQGSDLKSTTRLVEAIIELEHNARDYAQLNSSISLLSKKHGQLKGAIQAMVELAMSWLDEIKQRDGTEKWFELIETLRTVTEGKVRRALAASCNVTHTCVTRLALLGDATGTRHALSSPPP